MWLNFVTPFLIDKNSFLFLKHSFLKQKAFERPGVYFFVENCLTLFKKCIKNLIYFFGIEFVGKQGFNKLSNESFL